MRKQGDWSEDPTQVFREQREKAALPVGFEEEGGNTVLETIQEILARTHVPARATERPTLPPPRRPVAFGAAAQAPLPRVPTPPARPSVPYLTTRLPTPRPEIVMPSASERRLTLTPLPVANAASVPVPALAPISRRTPLAPARAFRAEVAKYRFIGLVALTGFTLGMAVFFLARAIV
jgi:hypothetical protein